MTQPTDLSRLASTLAPIAQQLTALAALEDALPEVEASDAITTARIDLLHEVIGAVLDQYAGRPDEVSDAAEMIAANRAARNRAA